MKTGLLGSWVAGLLGRSSRLVCSPSNLATQQPLTLVILLVVIMIAAPVASACPVCYGNPSDPMVKGTNNGVWVLLGIIGFVQIGFVAMFWSFWKRARDQRRFRDQFHVIEGGPHS